ncbi:Rho guanine nucleotide exchange factor 7 isoform 3 [Schistosoma japonicum]|uniref:Rho guanine nucleotide exchange factor 7 isoform 3 n=1 Tax=Schistosoma japonicum TaxID=6182 RepID=A0A4Z2D2W3_SCHJA|nr:Rho guanine nucleotide exchange factor 7 isoform 3 [Schistosoma japonicum]
MEDFVGDVLQVSKQLEGGWWEGSLDGFVGWFPSNYVTYTTSADIKNNTTTDESLLMHLQSFQNEIIQHVLEGELRQVSELSQLLSIFMIDLEPLLHLSFLNKFIHLRDILSQTISIHQHLASALSEMKRTHGPKCMGRLFLDFAPAINAVSCDYSKIYLHVITGLEEHIADITKHMASFNINLHLPDCKQQLMLVFERLGRYPLFLKEMERYLEELHIDRADILRAIHIYGEITERCAILRKFKEYDINVLLSVINGWHGPPIQQLGDPILTLRVLLVNIQIDQSHVALLDFICTDDLMAIKTQLSLLVIFPTCVLLLARTNQSNVYDYTTKVPLNNLTVTSSTESETDLDLWIKVDHSSTNIKVIPCQITLTCTDQNARDLLVSTLTDLIQYQILNEQQEPTDIDQSHEINGSIYFDYFSQRDFIDMNNQENISYVSSPSRKDDLEGERLELSSPKVIESENIQSDHHQSPVMMMTFPTKNSDTHNFVVEQSPMKDIFNTSFVDSATTNENNSNDNNLNTSTNVFSNTINNNYYDKCRLSSLKRSKIPRPLTEPSWMYVGQLNTESQHQQPSFIVSRLTDNHSQSKEIITTMRTHAKIPSSDVLTAPSSSSLLFLPHRITTDAHVRSFGVDKSIICKKHPFPASSHLSSIICNKNNEHLSSSDDLVHAIRYLRVDGPTDFTRNYRICSVSALNNFGLVGDHNTSGVSIDSSVSYMNQYNRVRPQSPKIADSSKESRRKRGNRQKSSITAEDVLRSVGKIRENELRTADDARILQVIEAYCASSWTHHGYRALDSVKSESRIGHGILSPIESKTLLQHFRYPKKSSVLSIFSVPISSTSDIHLKQEPNFNVTDNCMLKSSRQSLTQSVLISKASLKRSESKSKSQTCLSRDTAVNCNQNTSTNVTASDGAIVVSVTSNTGCITVSCTPYSPDQSSSYIPRMQCESILQTFSPPPVVLPTRSGRR